MVGGAVGRAGGSRGCRGRLHECMGLLAQVMFFSSTLFMQFGLIFPPGYLS